MRRSDKNKTVVIVSDIASTFMEAATRIETIWQPDRRVDVPRILALAINYEQDAPASALDTALAAYCSEAAILLPSSSPMTAYPFDPTVAMSGNSWHYGREYELAIKGAPEAVLARCSLTEAEREEAHKAFAAIASSGQRVVAVAYALLPLSPSTLTPLSGMQFVGFIATAYTPRPEARRAIKNALGTGLSVRVITGDYPETAFAIGHRLGLVSRRSQVLDSSTLHFMDDESRTQAVSRAIIFARTTKKEKSIITELLKKEYDIVADTLPGMV